MRFEYLGLSERECRAIRAAHDGLACFQVEYSDLTIRFKDAAGMFTVPIDAAREYIAAWRKSGLWTLPGRAAHQTAEQR